MWWYSQEPFRSHQLLLQCWTGAHCGVPCSPSSYSPYSQLFWPRKPGWTEGIHNFCASRMQPVWTPGRQGCRAPLGFTFSFAGRCFLFCFVCFELFFHIAGTKQSVWQNLSLLSSLNSGNLRFDTWHLQWLFLGCAGCTSLRDEFLLLAKGKERKSMLKLGDWWNSFCFDVSVALGSP